MKPFAKLFLLGVFALRLAAQPTAPTNVPVYKSATNALLGNLTTGTNTLGVASGGTLNGAGAFDFSGASSFTLPASFTWSGILAGVNGGTGVANTGKTITLGGNLTTSGAFATTLTATANTTVTLPTTGTLATLAGAESLTNKKLGSLTSNGLVTTSAGDGTLSVTVPGTGVLPALAVNTGSAGAFVVNGGALGTPSSGTVTNLTGTASININGTVGATTPAAGTFTTLGTTGASYLTASAANAAGSVRLSATNTDASGASDAFFFNAGGKFSGFQQWGASASGTFATLTNANLSKLVANGDNFVIGTTSASPVYFVTNGNLVGNFSSGGTFNINALTFTSSATNVADFTGLTKSGTSTTAAAILGKSMGLSENLYVGGLLNVAGSITTSNSSAATDATFFATNSIASQYSGLRLTNTGTSGVAYEIGLGGNTAADSGRQNKVYIYALNGSGRIWTIDGSGNTIQTGNLTVSGTGNSPFSGSVTAAKYYSATATALTYASPTSVDPTLASTFTVTTVNATGSVTFNSSGTGVSGQRMAIIITNDATSAKTITFGSNFTANGTLTASAASKKTTIQFISDGSGFVEVSRTVLP